MDIELTPVLIIGTLCYLVGFIVETLSKNRLRSKVITSGISDEKFLQGLFTKPQKIDNRYQSLKWGLILLFTGMGLIILEFIPYQHDSPLPYGIEATAVALGFLIYYLIVNRKAHQEEH